MPASRILLASWAVVVVALPAGTVFAQQQIVDPGEAALFSAQNITLPDGDRQVTFKAGMDAPGSDNRQFALNVPHWLSGLVPATPQGR